MHSFAHSLMRTIHSRTQLTHALTFHYHLYSFSQYPIGILYDMFTTTQRLLCVLPWKVTLHFQGYPTNRLLKCSSLLEMENHYSHSLKQALFLIHGSTRAFNELSVIQQQRIWSGASRGHRDQFEEVAMPLRLPEAQMRHIPVRLVHLSKQVVQRPVHATVISKEGMRQPTTLGDVIFAYAESVSMQQRQILPRAICQGIELPPHLGIYPLWRSFASADFFLYIILAEEE